MRRGEVGATDLIKFTEFYSKSAATPMGQTWHLTKLWFSNKLWSWMPKATLRKLMIEEPARIASMVEIKAYE